MFIYVDWTSSVLMKLFTFVRVVADPRSYWMCQQDYGIKCVDVKHMCFHLGWGIKCVDVMISICLVYCRSMNLLEIFNAIGA